MIQKYRIWEKITRCGILISIKWISCHTLYCLVLSVCVLVFDSVICSVTFSQQVKFVEFSFSLFEARPNTCVLEDSWEGGNDTGLHCQEHPRENLDRTERLCQPGMFARAARISMIMTFCSSPSAPFACSHAGY